MASPAATAAEVVTTRSALLLSLIVALPISPMWLTAAVKCAVTVLSASMVTDAAAGTGAGAAPVVEDVPGRGRGRDGDDRACRIAVDPGRRIGGATAGRIHRDCQIKRGLHGEVGRDGLDGVHGDRAGAGVGAGAGAAPGAEHVAGSWVWL